VREFSCTLAPFHCTPFTGKHRGRSMENGLSCLPAAALVPSCLCWSRPLPPFERKGLRPYTRLLPGGFSGRRGMEEEEEKG
jgi:hypothetical protein